MAFQHNGYAFVPQVITYDEWRNYCLNHGVNVDFSYGNQCWDVCALLWYQYGLRLQTGPLGVAFECWTVSKNANARPPFAAVEGVENIKRGDCIVFNREGSFWRGHIGFADEDYNGSGFINCLGQNQGQGTGYGIPSNVVRMSVRNILGGFRNTKWKVSPDPEPPTPESKPHKFPWVLYSNKFRGRR